MLRDGQLTHMGHGSETLGEKAKILQQKILDIQLEEILEYSVAVSTLNTSHKPVKGEFPKGKILHPFNFLDQILLT